MKAMILAAGLGTRLSPLTDDRPKALVPFKGVPMVEGIIGKLYHAGIREIVVNVHHYAEQVIDFLRQFRLSGLEIFISDERDCLMDTGGAVLQAREHFRGEGSFLVHNVDVWTNLDIPALMEANRKEAPLVSMPSASSTGWVRVLSRIDGTNDNRISGAITRIQITRRNRIQM